MCYEAVRVTAVTGIRGRTWPPSVPSTTTLLGCDMRITPSASALGGEQPGRRQRRRDLMSARRHRSGTCNAGKPPPRRRLAARNLCTESKPTSLLATSSRPRCNRSCGSRYDASAVPPCDPPEQPGAGSIPRHQRGSSSSANSGSTRASGTVCYAAAGALLTGASTPHRSLLG